MDTDAGVILLAAGGSSRLGQAKQLVKHQGDALVRRTARLALEVTPCCVVVTGAVADLVGKALDGLPLIQVHNPDWRAGMAGSLAMGTRSLPSEINGAMVLLCDQWRLEQPDLVRLLTAWRSDPGKITAATWEDSFGPPVVFPRSRFPQLLDLEGDRGARAIISNNADSTNFVPIPHAADDLDSPEDLLRMRRFGKTAGN
jgi:molybdenum cofactor cytidylyltransferase